MLEQLEIRHSDERGRGSSRAPLPPTSCCAHCRRLVADDAERAAAAASASRARPAAVRALRRSGALQALRR